MEKEKQAERRVSQREGRQIGKRETGGTEGQTIRSKHRQTDTD